VNVVACERRLARAGAASVDLSRIVVVGDSVLAGFASGGLVHRGRMGQRDSAPALVARQAGAKLPLPSMSRPGFPSPLVIADRNQNRVLDPGEVRRRARGIGFRSQPGREAHNLAVPGERVSTVLDAAIGEVATDAPRRRARPRHHEGCHRGPLLEDIRLAADARPGHRPDAAARLARQQRYLGSVTRANSSAGLRRRPSLAPSIAARTHSPTPGPDGPANIPDDRCRCPARPTR
jgi:hypothetical protein